MFTFAFCNQKICNVCHRKSNLFKSCISKHQFLLRAVSFYIGDICKMPSLYETFRDRRCYICCCRELMNGMIGLTSSGQAAIFMMTNFPVKFSQESYFYISLFLSVHCQFLISNCSWGYFF